MYYSFSIFYFACMSDISSPSQKTDIPSIPKNRNQDIINTDIIDNQEKVFWETHRILHPKIYTENTSNIEILENISPLVITPELENAYPNHAVLYRKLYTTYQNFKETYITASKTVGDDDIQKVQSLLDMDIRTLDESYRFLCTRVHILPYAEKWPENNPDNTLKELRTMCKLLQHKTRILREKYLFSA